MSNEFNQYDPGALSFVFKGLKFTQFQEGTFIDGEMKNNQFDVHEGANGDVTRTRIRSRVGSVTLTLLSQGSDNDNMQAIADEDAQFGTGVGTLQVLDHNGNMEIHATKAWIRKRPKIDRAKEAGSTVWVLDCADLEMNAGGNITASAF